MPILVCLALAAVLQLADVAPAEPAVAEQRVTVDVLGSVKHPGLYHLPLGARVVDAIAAAGGPAANAALDQVQLADQLQDGESLEVPAHQAAARVQQARSNLRTAVREGPRHQVRARQHHLRQAVESSGHGGKIDLNRASASDLEQLPGIGPGLAARILAYRARHGRFHSVQELEEVSGIGDRRLARIAPSVLVR